MKFGSVFSLIGCSYDANNNKLNLTYYGITWITYKGANTTCDVLVVITANF